MSDEIQFGEVEQAEPEVALRPDQDAHFATSEVGELVPGELPIYVDLDVMRDMEAHALSNTRVELGGVMLGKQLLDQQGNPYVVVTDSLRAEHYEATKGSFKFTHDTWSRITRQRAEFHPDLEMVGWYHTHPGWSVFLSGMDLFICNNFFNRPLDVALVIDPCEQDRGWFQWTGDSPPQTRRTGGFILTTGRFRVDELNYFARLYNKEPDMNIDPRYSPSSAGSTSVQLLDGRKSSMELAVIGMLAMQFMLMLVLTWRILSPSVAADETEKLKAKVDQIESEKEKSLTESIYADALERVSLAKTGDPSYGSSLVKLKENETNLSENLEAQMSRNRELRKLFESSEKQRIASERKVERTESRLKTAEAKLKTTETSLDTLKASIDADGKVIQKDWWMVAGVSLLTLGLGLAGGYFMAPKRESFDDLPPEKNRFTRSSNSSPEAPTSDSPETGQGDAMVFVEDSE